MPVAERAQARQVVVVGNVDAALALDGFDDDGRGLVVDGRFHRGQVVVRARGRTRRRNGSIALAGLLAARRVHRREAAPVESALGGDHLVPVPAVSPAVEPNQLEGRLVRVRPAVTEAAETSEPVRGDRLGQQRLWLGVQVVPDVPELACLLGGRGDQLGMAVPEDRPAETGEQVEVAPSGRVDELAAGAFDHRDADARIVRRQIPVASGNGGVDGDIHIFVDGVGHSGLPEVSARCLCAAFVIAPCIRRRPGARGRPQGSLRGCTARGRQQPPPRACRDGRWAASPRRTPRPGPRGA